MGRQNLSQSRSPMPFSKFKNGILIMRFLHYFTYYILHKKLRNFFKQMIFHEWCRSFILCYEVIHHFFEKFKFYSHVYATLRLLNTSEGASWWLRKTFLSKANKREFHLKIEVHATCAAPTLRDASIAGQFMNINSFIILK